MRGFIKTTAIVVFCGMFLVGLLPFRTASALAPPTGSILIGQVKITSSNGQFVSLYNNTAADIDMSTVQLAYYNFYDLTSTKLTSSRYIPLSGKLASHNYYLVSDGAMTICYKMTVSAQSLGFSSTAGTLQVTQNGPSNVLDSVAWSKTAVTTPAGVQTLPATTNGFLQRAWLEGIAKTANDPWISVLPTGLDGCDLQTQIAASASPVVPLPTAAPQKVKTVTAPAPSVTTPNNVGMVAPELTELFPNPAAPQNDNTDEFIELYNPNDAVFNLTGYRIEVGTTYSRGFTFTAVPLANLQPRSYTAFKISDTGLQLSNTEGQARLLDPGGTTISETPAYESAPEGQSWSVIGDSWQWTDTPTPNAVNLPSALHAVNATTPKATPTNKAKTTIPKTATSKKPTGTVKGASTIKPSGGAAKTINDASPLHPLILVGVGALAVGYALYEYRADMANNYFKFRRYIRNRWAARP